MTGQQSPLRLAPAVVQQLPLGNTVTSGEPDSPSELQGQHSMHSMDAMWPASPHTPSSAQTAYMHYSPDPPFVMENQQHLSAPLHPSIRGAAPFIFGATIGVDHSRLLNLAPEPVATHLRTCLPRPPYPPHPLRDPLRPSHWPRPDHAGNSEGKQSPPISTVQHQLESRTAVIYTREMQTQPRASGLTLPDPPHSDLPTALEYAISEQEGISISPPHRQPLDLSHPPLTSSGRRLLSTDVLQHAQSDPGFLADAPTSQKEDWEDDTRQEYCRQQILLQQQQLMHNSRQPSQQQQQHQAKQQQAGSSSTLSAMMYSTDSHECSLDSCKGEDMMMGFAPDCHEPDPAWWLDAAMNPPPDSLVATEQSESADGTGQQRHYIATYKSGKQN